MFLDESPVDPRRCCLEQRPDGAIVVRVPSRARAGGSPCPTPCSPSVPAIRSSPSGSSNSRGPARLPDSAALPLFSTPPARALFSEADRDPLLARSAARLTTMSLARPRLVSGRYAAMNGESNAPAACPLALAVAHAHCRGDPAAGISAKMVVCPCAIFGLGFCQAQFRDRVDTDNMAPGQNLERLTGKGATETAPDVCGSAR